MGSTFGAELVEQTTRVRFHRVLADEQFGGDLAGAEPRRDRLEDLELSWGDAELSHARRIGDERVGYADQYLDGHGHLAHDDRFARSRELEAEPDADDREQKRDDAAVDLDRVLDDEKPVLDELEAGDQQTTEEAVQHNRLFHAYRQPHCSRATS